MFGHKIDYWLLKPLSHKRNLLTEDQLNSVSKAELPMAEDFNIDDELKRIKKFDSRFNNSVFKGKENKTYIDVGCGMAATSCDTCSSILPFFILT